MTDSSVEGDVHRPYDPPMEDRVARLEEDMRDVKSVLPRLEPMIIRIDATLTVTLPNLATKAELAELRTEVTKEIEDLRVGFTKEIADVRTELRKEIMDVRTDLGKEIADLRNEMTDRFADVPTKTYLWGILAALITAYGGAGGDQVIPAAQRDDWYARGVDGAAARNQ